MIRVEVFWPNIVTNFKGWNAAFYDWNALRYWVYQDEPAFVMIQPKLDGRDFEHLTMDSEDVLTLLRIKYPNLIFEMMRT